MTCSHTHISHLLVSLYSFFFFIPFSFILALLHNLLKTDIIIICKMTIQELNHTGITKFYDDWLFDFDGE